MRALFLVVAAVAFGLGCGGAAKCDTTNCGGCCTSDGQCQAGTTDAWCGTGGKLCVVCPSKQVCKASACVAQAVSTCNASNCNGCCDNTGSCFTGNTVEACGTNGATCAVCTSGKTCTVGACQ